MKNTRSRRPDQVGGMGGDLCEPPNRQRFNPRTHMGCDIATEKAFFATQEPFSPSERTISPSEPSKQPKSPQNAFLSNKKADRITPIGSHTCHVRVSFNSTRQWRTQQRYAYPLKTSGHLEARNGRTAHNDNG